MSFTFTDFHPTTQVFFLFLKYIADGEGTPEPQAIPQENSLPINWKEFFESGDGDVVLEGFGELFKTCGYPVLSNEEAQVDEATVSSVFAGRDKGGPSSSAYAVTQLHGTPTPSSIAGSSRPILREQSLNDIYRAPSLAPSPATTHSVSIPCTPSPKRPREDGANYYPRANYDKRTSGQNVPASSVSASKRRKV